MPGEELECSGDDGRVVAEQQPSQRRHEADQQQIGDAACVRNRSSSAERIDDGLVFMCCLSITAVANRLEHGQHVLRRRVALDVVDRVEDEARRPG